MIPVALVTGFLGSGKTALLRNIIRTHRGRRIVYLVNEFSSVDVDGHVLSAETDGVVELPGGSIFCTCLVTDFIKALTDIPHRFGVEERVDAVVIEASGVANPKVIQKMLRETRLDELFALSAIVTVVDPGTFPVLIETLPNVRAQVEAGDVVVVNKVDLYDAATVERTEALVREIRPDAVCVRTTYGVADLPLFGGAPSRRLEGDYASCADPNFARLVIRMGGDVSIEALRQAVEPARDAVYRLKGFVRAEGQYWYVDYSAAAFTIRPSGGTVDATDLVLIGRGDAGDVLQGLARTLSQTVQPCAVDE